MGAQVLHPELTGILGCQDNPTLLAFGINDRAGRMAISPRDFARFGLLYLNYGNWNGTQLISEDHARMAVGKYPAHHCCGGPDDSRPANNWFNEHSGRSVRSSGKL